VLRRRRRAHPEEGAAGDHRLRGGGQGQARRDDPKVFTEIHLHFVVSGRELSENHVKRAVELSSDKYCSASIMLQNGGVKVTHDYEIAAAK